MIKPEFTAWVDGAGLSISARAVETVAKLHEGDALDLVAVTEAGKISVSPLRNKHNLHHN